MTSSSSTENRKQLLTAYVERLEAGEGLDALLREIQSAHPRLANSFRELAANLGDLQKTGAEDQPPPNFPDFEYLGFLGQGGMGAVYRAKQLSLGRIVALKLYDGRTHSGLQWRFECEQQTLAKLHHTNIAPIHTAGQVGDWRYFAMKFIDGASLRHLVAAALSHTLSGKHAPTPSLEQLAKEHDPAQSVNPQRRDANDANQKCSIAKFSASMDYYRSVAHGLAGVADALHHAHGANILHRDVKPSNIMVDKSGTCWLVDLGLSRERIVVEPQTSTSPVQESESAFIESVRESGSVDRAASNQTHGWVGTECYVAPEQYRGKCDERSDIYGFGVTLYEVLSLRPAFEEQSWRATLATKKLPEPIPVEQLVPTIPVDLAAICRKAMQPIAADRYVTAAEIADDLRHWLAGEPTKANPPGLVRRLRLWTQRNKTLAAALSVTAISVLLFAVFASLAWRYQTDRATAAEQLAANQEFDLRLNDIRAVRLFSVDESSRGVATPLICETAAKVLTESQMASLRDEAAFWLTGIRVNRRREMLRDCSSVAFDAAGQRLLCGGWTDLAGTPFQRAEIWDFREGEKSHRAGCLGSGPVAFQPDGSPVQVAWEDTQTLTLWNVEQDRLLHRWKFDDKVNHGQLGHSRIAPTAISFDGQLTAAAVAGVETPGKVFVWNNASGELKFTLPIPATALAFSRDGTMLACGGADGAVSIWSLRDGARVAAIKNNEKTVYCLDFSFDSRLDVDGSESRPRGRLVIGDAGALATIRDLQSTEVICYLRGSVHWISAVAFAPNDFLIATAGLWAVTLWNGNTGQMLLKLSVAHSITDVEFSCDGSQLVAASETTFAPGHTCLWELENGGGVSEYFGLDTMIMQAVLSPDDTLLAALAHDGEVDLWNRRDGRLLFRWSVPRADYVENTQIGFSLDGSTLYYAGQQEFIAWNTSAGSMEFDQIQLNPALGNKLALPESGEIMVLRMETQSGTQMPDSRSNRATDPRVFRLYHLNGTDPARPLRELHFSDRGAADPRMMLVDMEPSPDGMFYAIDAFLAPIGAIRGEGNRYVKAFDSLTGQEMFSVPSSYGDPHRSFHFPMRTRDDSGRTLRIDVDREHLSDIFVHLPTGERLREPLTLKKTDGVPVYDFIVNSQATLAMHSANVYYIKGDRVQATFNAGDNSSHGFSQSGNYWMTSTATGTVRVHDQARIRRELTQLGLGW